jgi:hypothetical protein
MHDSITVTAVSKDQTRILVTPGGDTTRSVWVSLGTPLETVTFPAPRTPAPAMRLAAWGEGKGVRGGFSSLQGRA